MNEIKLQPCPFCGGEAEIVGKQYLWGQCKRCRAQSPGNHNRRVAIESWNTRSPMEDLQDRYDEMLERIVKRLKDVMNDDGDICWSSAIDKAIEIVEREGGLW